MDFALSEEQEELQRMKKKLPDVYERIAQLAEERGPSDE